MNPNQVSCNLCGITCSGPESFEQHINSLKHKTKFRNQELSEICKPKENLHHLESDVPSVKQFCKPVDSFLCDICEISCSGLNSYQQHINSSKHKKVLLKRQLLNEQPDRDIKEKLLKDEKPYVSENTEFLVVLPQKHFLCLICNMTFHEQALYIQHQSSSDHIVNQQLKICFEHKNSDSAERHIFSSTPTFESEKKLYSALPQIEPFAWCQVCDKKFSGQESYEQHKISKAHKKKVAIIEFMKNVRSGNTSLGCSTNNQEISTSCTLCHKVFTGHVPYQQHMISKSHLKQKRKHEILEKLNNLILNTPNVEEASTKDTNNDSLEIAENCQEKPATENVNETTQELKLPQSDSQVAFQMDLSQMNISFCNVCNKSFSGIESAMEHYVSKRHCKIKQQKENLTKLPHLSPFSNYVYQNRDSQKCNEISALLDGCQATDISSSTAEDQKANDAEFSLQENESFASKDNLNELNHDIHMESNLKLKEGEQIQSDMQKKDQSDLYFVTDSVSGEVPPKEKDASEYESNLLVETTSSKTFAVETAINPSVCLNECEYCNVKLFNINDLKCHYESNDHLIAKQLQRKKMD